MGQKQSRKTSPLSDQVAQIVSDICKEKGLTQAQVGSFLGTTHVQAGRLIRGERAMTTTELDAIAKGLGLRGSDILAEAESRLAVLEAQEGFTLAASVREPDPYEGLGEESQDV